MRAPKLTPSLAALSLALLASCQGTRTLSHPTVRIETPGGVELGASTDYGLVFLGRTARSGEIDVTAWYGDGPSIERAVIEPVTADFCTAETEIRLPSVPLAFEDPAPGEHLFVIGRTLVEFWRADVVVLSDPRIEGILIDMPPELDGRPDQIGAGVYKPIDGNPDDLELVGLVSGRIHLDTRDGPRDYMTVLGPRDLWRLVTLRRDREQRRHWVYREDIL